MMTCETRIHKRVRDCLARTSDNHGDLPLMWREQQGKRDKVAWLNIARHKMKRYGGINCDERRHSDTSTLNGECGSGQQKARFED